MGAFSKGLVYLNVIAYLGLISIFHCPLYAEDSKLKCLHFMQICMLGHFLASVQTSLVSALQPSMITPVECNLCRIIKLSHKRKFRTWLWAFRIHSLSKSNYFFQQQWGLDIYQGEQRSYHAEQLEGKLKTRIVINSHNQYAFSPLDVYIMLSITSLCHIDGLVSVI